MYLGSSSENYKSVLSLSWKSVMTANPVCNTKSLFTRFDNPEKKLQDLSSGDPECFLVSYFLGLLPLFRGQGSGWSPLV